MKADVDENAFLVTDYHDYISRYLYTDCNNYSVILYNV